MVKQFYLALSHVNELFLVVSSCLPHPLIVYNQIRVCIRPDRALRVPEGVVAATPALFYFSGYLLFLPSFSNGMGTSFFRRKPEPGAGRSLAIMNPSEPQPNW